MNAAKGSGLEWFVRRNAVVRGPFSSTRVRHFVLEGRLQLDDEVSLDKIQWRRLGGVLEVVPLQLRSDDAGLSAEQALQRKGDRRGAMRSIAVALAVVLTLTIGVSLIGSRRAADVRDCAAPPAPGVLLEGCQLSGADMTGKVLNGARMANAILTGAKLTESNLDQGDLRYADLTGADLSYARLRAANLMGASLRFADLTNADLSAANLSFADLSGARLGGALLGQVQFDGAIWTDGRRCGAADCPRAATP